MQLNFDFLVKTGWSKANKAMLFTNDTIEFLKKTNVEFTIWFITTDVATFCLVTIYKGTKYDRHRDIYFYVIIKKLSNNEIISDIRSNIDLFRYIIDNKACCKEYARYFDLQKILKNE